MGKMYDGVSRGAMQRWERKSDFQKHFGGAAKRLGQITKFGC